MSDYNILLVDHIDKANYTIQEDGRLDVKLAEPPLELIRIYLCNDRLEDNQIETLLNLMTQLCIQYQIPLNQIQGEVNFPWFDFLNCLATNIVDKQVSVNQ